MVSGHSRSGLADVLEVAQDLGSTVVSVDYRLAPETRHPGPVNDCFSALTWIGDHATELGAPNGHVIVLGSSAGGGLAAGAVLMARDRGYPAVSGMMLLSPMLDDRDTYSAHQMAGIDTWDLAKNHVGWDALLGEARGTDGVSPYAAPGRAADLAKLPATYVEVGSAETFRDESVSFASRIWEAGGAGELHIWPGTFHGFDVVAPRAPLAQLARHTRLEWLQRLISTFN
jgi:acetyl esterase/lipase